MPAFNSADRIITQAMRNAGLLDDLSSPSTDQYTAYLPRLNDLINFWQTQGLKLWLQYDLGVTLVQGQEKYTISPTGDVVMTKPTRILDNGYFLDTNGTRRPLMLISRDEWTRLSNHSTEGAISSYFVDKLRDKIDVYVWTLPDATAATGTLHVLIQQQITNLVTVNDSMDFPQEWFIALHWGLADEISTGQPQAIMDRCTQRAQFYREKLEDWDVEDASTFFQMDARNRGIR